jgi:hypothetical protein
MAADMVHPPVNKGRSVDDRAEGMIVEGDDTMVRSLPLYYSCAPDLLNRKRRPGADGGVPKKSRTCTRASGKLIRNLLNWFQNSPQWGK